MNNGNGQRQPSATSGGAPPNRGGAGGGSGHSGGELRTPLGTVRVTRSGGKVNIQIPPALRADWEEGARISHMTLAEFAHEQVQAGEEIASGGNGGLITESTRTYR